jgi:hypothetical protein
MRRFGKGSGVPAGRPIQFFDYGPLRFNVNRAAVLAANRKKYRPEPRQASPAWIGSLIEIDEGHVERCDPSQPVLFATLALPGHPRELLIDGNHRVVHALRHGKQVRALVLDLEDTLQVVAGPDHLIRQMQECGRALGLLSGQGAAGSGPAPQ